MPADQSKRTMHQSLVDRILRGDGEASPEQRAAAFHNAGVPPPIQSLIDKVACASATVTDADFASAKAGGLSEDQIFELVICAAVGQSSRQYEAGLAALADAIGQRGS